MKSTEKKAPRRLFSLENLKNTATRRSSSESTSRPSIDEHLPHSHARFQTLDQVAEASGEQEYVIEPTALWTGQAATTTATTSPPHSRSRFLRQAKSNQSLTTLTPSRVAPSFSAPDEIPASPSQTRWKSIRQHVVPAPARPSTPTRPSGRPPTPTRPSTPARPTTPGYGTTTTPPASNSSFSINTPARPQTPKPSRFAQKLGFRQVVDQITTDESARFDHELQTVCMQLHSQRSTQHALPSTLSSTAINVATGKKYDPRRPSSFHSSPQSTHLPSVKSLFTTLSHFSVPQADGVPPIDRLPREEQVLSVLLLCFLTPEQGPLVEEERWVSVQAFELITRTWKPADQETAVARCIWCTKAAMIPASPIRTRIIGSLWAMIVPRTSTSMNPSPQALYSLTKSLFLLLFFIQADTPEETEDSRTLSDVIRQIRFGCCGELDLLALEEVYDALVVGKEDTQAVRDALLLSGMTECFENSPIYVQRYILRAAIEVYWPLPIENTTLTPLVKALTTQRLLSFSRTAYIILTVAESHRNPNDPRLIAAFVDTHILPDMDLLRENTTNEVRHNVVKVVLVLLNHAELAQWAASIVSHWYRDSPAWKSAFEQTLDEGVKSSQWTTVIATSDSLLRELPEDVRRQIVAFIVPVLSEQILNDPPAYPYAPLTKLLDTISCAYPQVFYKPLFSCAASSKELSVTNSLCIITSLSRFLPDFWYRNSEMMSIALTSDASQPVGGSIPTWGTARLGQLVLCLELTSKLQKTRQSKEESLIAESDYVAAVKFALTLESRLAVMIDHKERLVLIPPVQRLLFSLLLRETRLLSHSLKSASWLPRIVSWFIDFHADEMHVPLETELEAAIDQIQGLYSIARDGIRSSKRRSTMLLSPTQNGLSAGAESSSTLPGLLAPEKLVASLSKGFISRMLKLLVTVSVLLTGKDHQRIGPVLWDHYLESADESMLLSTCLLIMQSAEKAPHELLTTIEVDLESNSAFKRLVAVRKLSILSALRFQTITLHMLSDRAHRPFKVARGPLPFVATDIGTSQFIKQVDPSELKDNLPLELRKRLADIGWVDEEDIRDEQQDWIQTPVSLLSFQQLERLDSTLESNTSPPLSSPQRASAHEGGGLLRRTSSSGGPMLGVKRRAIFVHSIAGLFPRIAQLAGDSDINVATTAQHLIFDLMRNDPALITRSALELLEGPLKSTNRAVSSLHSLIHIRPILPPVMAHHLLNHIAGFLKFLSKRVEASDETLYEFAHCLPLISKLAQQVGDVSIRELRRAKIDPFLITYGALWFNHTSPPGPMFPRHLHSAIIGGSQSVPQDLISIVMIRITQSSLLLGMLKRNRQEFQLIRKLLSPLQLPTWDGCPVEGPIELNHYVPRRHPPSQKSSPRTAKIKLLSLALSRSYVPLVAEFFQCMSRHSSDLSELTMLMDGLNRILLLHGDDVNIVHHCLIALLIASARFKRLFATGGGYTLFMPSLLKVYIENAENLGIRRAIEYAAHRFYAHHNETFVFQTLDVMSHIIHLARGDLDWMASNIFSLFATLRKSIPQPTPDVAGIHDATTGQEHEALILNTAEEKPQTFFASLHRTGTVGKDQLAAALIQEYEGSRLALDNFVRLFLTVIAHDVTIARAQNFLKLLRYLAPHIYEGSGSARNVLVEGVNALGTILLKLVPKPKQSDEVEGPRVETSPQESQLSEKTRQPSSILQMQLDYLAMALAVLRSGCQPAPSATSKVFELVQLVLKEASSPDVNDDLAAFLSDYVALSCPSSKHPEPRYLASFLSRLSPILRTYTVVVDLSGVYRAVESFCSIPLYAGDRACMTAIGIHVCEAGLDSCEVLSSQNLLSTMASRGSLISLLAEAAIIPGSDVLSGIERRSPSYDFLSSVVLPFTLRMRTGSEMAKSGLANDSQTVGRAWVRVLAYVMTACQQLQSDRQPLKRTLSRSRTKPKSSQVPAILLGLQIIKIIVVRAEQDLSDALPAIWGRLGRLLLSILSEGNANFISRPLDQSPQGSPLPSPTPSPRASFQLEPSSRRNSFATDHLRPSSYAPTLSSPRVLDYALWSFMEFVTFHRTPLLIEFRLLLQQKLHTLDQDLSEQQQFQRYSGLQSRPLSSVFAKPRRRSAIPSPSQSPRLSPAQPLDVYGLQTIEPRESFYTPPADGPRIVHLGLVSHNMSISAASHGLSTSHTFQTKAGSMRIKSLVLCRWTYQRIRAIQFAQGYTTLLVRLLEETSRDDEPAPTIWSKSYVLGRIEAETSELAEEFEFHEASSNQDHEQSLENYRIST